jgi:hypothetical protein
MIARRHGASPLLPLMGGGTQIVETMAVRSAGGPQKYATVWRRSYFPPTLLQKLARPRGVEPLTPRSVVWCSIQLSYGRLRRSKPAMVAATTTPAAPENARWIEGDAVSWAGARKRPAMLPDNR